MKQALMNFVRRRHTLSHLITSKISGDNTWASSVTEDTRETSE